MNVLQARVYIYSEHSCITHLLTFTDSQAPEDENSTRKSYCNRCLAHGLSCLTVLAIDNQVIVNANCQTLTTEASDDIPRCHDDIVSYSLTKLSYIILLSIYHSLLFDCSAFLCVAVAEIHSGGGGKISGGGGKAS